ncbi:MAG: hypothetical protein A3J83_09150, partial [Elusimicrobia bacterium RIFOXYA2_FULL_40_6]
MLIGLISDTHDNLPLIAKAVDFFNKKGVNLVLHAGDFVSPFTSKEFKNLKSKFIAVFGNNDGDKKMLREKFEQIGVIYDKPHETNLEGNQLLLMHEPDSLDRLITAQQNDIIIYGHTHNPDIRTVGKTLIINPGECGGWLTGKSTIALLELPSKKV